MLKGENTLTLTHETVRCAIEQYLRAGLVDGARLAVTSVEEKSESRGYNNSGKSFDVKVAEVPGEGGGKSL